MKGLEGLTIEEKYEIDEFKDMMKAFALAATEGNLEQVRCKIDQFHFKQA